MKPGDIVVKRLETAYGTFKEGYVFFDWPEFAVHAEYVSDAFPALVVGVSDVMSSRYTVSTRVITVLLACGRPAYVFEKSVTVA